MYYDAVMSCECECCGCWALFVAVCKLWPACLFWFLRMLSARVRWLEVGRIPFSLGSRPQLPLRGMWHAPRRPGTPLSRLIWWVRPLLACYPRGARVAQRARRVLQFSLRVLGRVLLRIYKYTYSLLCVLVSLSYLILPLKLILFALHFSLSLSLVLAKLSL